jgi:hypothetical protein
MAVIIEPIENDKNLSALPNRSMIFFKEIGINTICSTNKTKNSFPRSLVKSLFITIEAIKIIIYNNIIKIIVAPKQQLQL